MPAKHSRHIALTGPLQDYVDGLVAQGEYASASDVVRAALRLMIERDGSAPRPSPASATGKGSLHG